MKALLKTPALYQDRDLRQLLQDTWKLVEKLNYSQMCDLITAINNVKLVMEYAVRTGMKDDHTGNHLSYAQNRKEPIQLQVNAQSPQQNAIYDNDTLVFSGNY